MQTSKSSFVYLDQMQNKILVFFDGYLDRNVCKFLCFGLFCFITSII